MLTRCRDLTAADCDVNKIGLFKLPSKTILTNQRHRQLQEDACSCSADAIADHGIFKSEFLDEFHVQIASAADSLECPNLQAMGGCEFGSQFDSILQVTFADPTAAQEATDEIATAALGTFNTIFLPDNPETCNSDFWVFQSVQVAFLDGGRCQLVGVGEAREGPAFQRDLQDNVMSQPPLSSLATLFNSMPTVSPTSHFASTTSPVDLT